MKQLSFETEYQKKRNPITRPLARDKDPIASHKAADKVIESGYADSQVDKIWQYIERFCNAMMRPDFTAKEVAWFVSREDNVDYYKTYITIQKRKSILKDRGLITEMNMERDGCTVWIKKEK